MHKSILDDHTPIEALSSRFCDMMGHHIRLKHIKLDRKGELTTEEAKRNAIKVYESIIYSATADKNERLKAQNSLDKLMGLGEDTGSSSAGGELRATLIAMRDEFGAAPPPANDSDASETAEEAS